MTAHQTLMGALLVLLCAPAVVGQRYHPRIAPMQSVEVEPPRHSGTVAPIVDGFSVGNYQAPMPTPIVDPPLQGPNDRAPGDSDLGFAPVHSNVNSTEPTMQWDPSREFVENNWNTLDSAEATAPHAAASGQLTDACEEDEWCLPRVWATAEYVLLWTDGANVPALVTTSVPGTLLDEAASLEVPTTSILFGGEELNGGARSGARITLGGWIDLCNMCGVELNFLVLGNDETRFAASDEFEILGRPFFNLTGDEEDAKLTNFPGLASGSLAAEIKSEFHTGEALFRKRVPGWGAAQVDWYLGYRNAGLIDDLRIVDNSTVLSGPASGTQFQLSDQFRTRNTFHGVDLGLTVGAVMPNLEYELTGRVAVGTTRTESEIIGSSTTTANGTATMSNVGFLVQPTNTGSFEDNSFSTVTELGITGKRMFRPGLSLTVGYTVIFWHDVSRAGDQIDTTINTTQFPPSVLTGDPRPRAQTLRSDFWAHGLRVGFEYLF